MDVKAHWENVYLTKADSEVSWYQQIPVTSLKLVENLNLRISDPIIDIGGGNANFVSKLLKKGYKDLTVLDISGNALKRSKLKLGLESEKIIWIESDVLKFKPTVKYHVWHDRATFHFLTKREDLIVYKAVLEDALLPGGKFILSTFSKNGPTHCSGLDICQHNADDLLQLFGDLFELITEFQEDHITPSGGIQNFTFTVWRSVKQDLQ